MIARHRANKLRISGGTFLPRDLLFCPDGCVLFVQRSRTRTPHLVPVVRSRQLGKLALGRIAGTLKQRFWNVFFGASCVIVLYRVDSGTNAVAAHGICLIWFEQIEDVIDLFESRIKPMIVVFALENYRHSVMNVGQKCIC